MRTINLIAIPNQSLSVRLDDVRYEFRFKETNGIMMVDITRNDVVILSGQRIVAGTPLIPYTYLEHGNFFILTEDEDLPYYTQFGITQSFVYLTVAEIEAIRAGI